MRKWLPIIFAAERYISIGAESFNHCSSLCPCESGTILAWYSGSGECRDDQSVYTTKLSRRRPSEYLRLGDKTGNPIVWREDNKNWLLWSKFEDTGPIRSPAHRWKYCSLWIQEINANPHVELVGEPRRVSHPDQHLLARCNPLVLAGITLLPLYDEMNRECVIYEGRDGTFQELSRYGRQHQIIQPTIWSDNGEFHSLSRNFGGPHGKKGSVYFHSSDEGATWEYGGVSYFRNVNNSLVVNKYNDEHVAIWNNTKSRHRDNLSIAVVRWVDGVPYPQVLKVIDESYGAYPNACVDDRNDLHFSYTDRNKQIVYHTWNKRAFEKALRRSKYSTR